MSANADLFVHERHKTSFRGRISPKKFGELHFFPLICTRIASGRTLTEILHALEASDFIEYCKPFENNKRNMMYRLVDPFCLFYLDQVEGRNRGENFWRDNENSAQLRTWRGRAFENACLRHVNQIKTAMGVGGVSSNNSSSTAMERCSTSMPILATSKVWQNC